VLGWDVSVLGGDADSDDRILAHWVTGPFGLAWIDKLVEDGKAKEIHSGGYPTAFSVSADVLIPILIAGLPETDSPPVFGDDYYLPENWSGSLHTDPEKLADCPKDATLIIEAWDQS
jgi:hypothetical protein